MLEQYYHKISRTTVNKERKSEKIYGKISLLLCTNKFMNFILGKLISKKICAANNNKSYYPET